LASLALFAVALSAYLAFLTVHYSYDAVASGILLYQWVIAGKVEPLFHRYHVLYLPFAAGVEWILTRIRIEVDPLTLLQVLNALFAAASVALYHRLARAFGLDGLGSAMLAVLFGGGFSYWYYATNGESYPISVFFLLLAFLSAARTPDGASWARSCAPGVWIGLAAGFHGSCLLALPGLVVLSWPGGHDRRGYRRVAATILAAGLVLGGAYVVRYLVIQRTDPVSRLNEDASAFAGEEGWSIRPRLLDQWRSLAHSMAPADWPALPSSHPRVTRALDAGLLALTLVPLALLPGVDRIRRRPALAAAVWAAVSFVFFSSYFAGSPKFATYQWAPLLLLVGLARQQAAGRPSVRLATTAALAILVGANLYCSFDLVRRQTDVESNPHLTRARAIARLTEPDDLIVHLGRGEDQYQKVYTPYFAVRRSLALDPYFRAGATAGQPLQALEARLVSAAAGSGRIVVLGDAVEPGPAGREFERAHGIQEGALSRFFAARRPRLLAEDPATGRVWMLTSPASREPEASPVPTRNLMPLH
jgi:hypothetical protein